MPAGAGRCHPAQPAVTTVRVILNDRRDPSVPESKCPGQGVEAAVYRLPLAAGGWRQGLLRRGAPALSNLELVALMLCGSRRPVAARGAERLLTRHSLGDLATATYATLRCANGAGPVAAATVVAAFELARRVYRPAPAPASISTPGDAYVLLRDLELATREHFVALSLNARNGVVARQTISIGGLRSTVVEPRDVYRAAVAQNARALVVAHNHPSGNPEPSADDLSITSRLAEAGRVLGIELIDHIVVGRGGFVSFRERGYL